MSLKSFINNKKFDSAKPEDVLIKSAQFSSVKKYFFLTHAKLFPLPFVPLSAKKQEKKLDALVEELREARNADAPNMAKVYKLAEKLCAKRPEETLAAVERILFYTPEDMKALTVVSSLVGMLMEYGQSNLLLDLQIHLRNTKQKAEEAYESSVPVPSSNAKFQKENTAAVWGIFNDIVKFHMKRIEDGQKATPAMEKIAREFYKISNNGDSVQTAIDKLEQSKNPKDVEIGKIAEHLLNDIEHSKEEQSKKA